MASQRRSILTQAHLSAQLQPVHSARQSRSGSSQTSHLTSTHCTSNPKPISSRSTALGLPGHGVISKGREKNGLPGRSAGQAPLHQPRFSTVSERRGPSLITESSMPSQKEPLESSTQKIRSPISLPLSLSVFFTALSFLYLFCLPLHFMLIHNTTVTWATLPLLGAF